MVKYQQQKDGCTMANFLEHGAISKEQHDKSLHDLTEMMGYGEKNLNSLRVL